MLDFPNFMQALKDFTTSLMDVVFGDYASKKKVSCVVQLVLQIMEPRRFERAFLECAEYVVRNNVSLHTAVGFKALGGCHCSTPVKW